MQSKSWALVVTWKVILWLILIQYSESFALLCPRRCISSSVSLTTRAFTLSKYSALHATMTRTTQNRRKGLNVPLAFQSTANQIDSLKDITINNAFKKYNFLSTTDLKGWEDSMHQSLHRIREIEKPQLVRDIYMELLEVASQKMINPMQFVWIDNIVKAIAMVLLDQRSEKVSIDEMMEDITDMNIILIDRCAQHFARSGDSLTLAYQLAGLISRLYVELDITSATTSRYLRLRQRMIPVLKHLKSNLPEFDIANAEGEYHKGIVISMEQFFNSLDIVGFLRQSKAANSPSNATDDPIVAQLFKSSVDFAPEYDPWEAAIVVLKIVKYTYSSLPIPNFEYFVSNMLTASLAPALRNVSITLELSNLAGNTSEVSNHLSTLNLLGDCVVMGIIVMWHTRYAIVGDTFPKLDSNDNTIIGDFPLQGYYPNPALTSKQFLQRFSLSANPTDLMSSLPIHMHYELSNLLTDQTYNTKLNDGTNDLQMQSIMLLSHALRLSTGQEFRSLITYNSQPEDWPQDRNCAFQLLAEKVMSAVLEETFLVHNLHSNRMSSTKLSLLLVVVSLEEPLGIRTPTALYEIAYSRALQHHIEMNGEYLVINCSSPGVLLQQRLDWIENYFTSVFRMNPGQFQRIRENAFVQGVKSILSRYADNIINRYKFEAFEAPGAFNSMYNNQTNDANIQLQLKDLAEFYGVDDEMLAVASKKYTDDIFRGLLPVLLLSTASSSSHLACFQRIASLRAQPVDNKLINREVEVIALQQFCSLCETPMGFKDESVARLSLVKSLLENEIIRQCILKPKGVVDALEYFLQGCRRRAHKFVPVRFSNVEESALQDIAARISKARHIDSE